MKTECQRYLVAWEFGFNRALAADVSFKTKQDFLDLYVPIAKKHLVPPAETLKVEVKEIKNGVTMPRHDLQVYVDGQNLRVDDQSSEGDEISRVATPAKSFRVGRKTPVSQYLVEALHSDYQKEMKSARLAAPIVNPYYHFLEIPLYEFLEQPDIDFESGTEFKDENGELKALIKVNRTVETPTGDEETWRYEFEFLPEHDWVLSRYRLINGEYEVRFKHDFDQGSFPIVSRVEIEDRGPDGYTYDASYLVKNVRLVRPESNLFTLAAFGINNRVGEPQPSTFRFWLIAANVLLILAIAAFLWRLRRNA